MKNYEERLNTVIKERRNQNIDISDITFLYSDFVYRKSDKYNYIYIKRLKPFLKAQFNKRIKKDSFNKKLFSKILFNNLYMIRQEKEDLIPYGAKPESDLYKYYASHQYIRRELEHLTVNDIILLSWELVKRFKKSKQHNKRL